MHPASRCKSIAPRLIPSPRQSPLYLGPSSSSATAAAQLPRKTRAQRDERIRPRSGARIVTALFPIVYPGVFPCPCCCCYMCQSPHVETNKAQRASRCAPRQCCMPRGGQWTSCARLAVVTMTMMTLTPGPARLSSPRFKIVRMCCGRGASSRRPAMQPVCPHHCRLSLLRRFGAVQRAVVCFLDGGVADASFFLCVGIPCFLSWVWTLLIRVTGVWGLCIAAGGSSDSGVFVCVLVR